MTKETLSIAVISCPGFMKLKEDENFPDEDIRTEPLNYPRIPVIVTQILSEKGYSTNIKCPFSLYDVDDKKDICDRINHLEENKKPALFTTAPCPYFSLYSFKDK